MDSCHKNINDCESFNQTSSLADLKEQCFKDDGCVAVSCDVDESKDNMCNRYMFSSTCDNSTIQESKGWTYHLWIYGENITKFILFKRLLQVNLTRVS